MRNHLVIIALALVISGCHYSESSTHHSHVSRLNHFSYENYDPYHPTIVDPYYHDGLFEVQWDFLNINSDFNLRLEITSTHGHFYPVEVLLRQYHVHGNTRIRSSVTFYFDEDRQLWLIDEYGQFIWLADLLDEGVVDEYAELKLTAYEEDGQYFVSSRSIRFW